MKKELAFVLGGGGARGALKALLTDAGRQQPGLSQVCRRFGLSGWG